MHKPLVVDVPVGAVDSDTGVVEEAYQMVFPPLIESAFDNTDITPLTTVLWDIFKDQFLVKDEDLNSPTLACDIIRENHEKVDQLKVQIDATIAEIVHHYNISEEAIFADFIANGDSETHELAQLIVKGLKKGLSEAQELKTNHPNSYVDVKYLKNEDKWIRREYIYTPHGNNDSNGWSGHSRVRSVTHSVSDDLEVIGEQIDFYNRDGAAKNIDEDKVELAVSEESCNSNEYYNYYENKDSGELHEREITNITSTCGGENSKYLFNMIWESSEKELGHVGQFSVKFDAENDMFMMLDEIKDFHKNKNKLDFDALNAEIDLLDYHYDDELNDTLELLHLFKFMSLTKKTLENELKVEYNRVLSDSGWSYRTKRFNADGTYSEECKDAGSDTWGECS